MTDKGPDATDRITRGSPLALLLLFAAMSSAFSAGFVWIVLTPHLDNPVHWLGKLIAIGPVAFTLAALLLASGVLAKRV